MNDVESPHDEGEDEVHLREDDPQPETTPPTPITSHDMDVIIKGWEVKFEQILRCLGEVQLASEKANSDIYGMSREGRAREDQQERRIEAMHVGFTEFIEKCDPAHLIGSRHLDAPPASTPYTPSTPTGLPSRLRPDFEFHPSPVGQDEPTESARSTNSHTREHDAIRDTLTRDHDDIRDTRTRDHDDIRNTRIREHNDARNARTRFNERPTHEDDRGDSGDMQRSSYHSGMSTSMSRPSSSPIRRQTPVGEIKCWTCGKTGHYASDCKSSGPKFAFAPKPLKMNFPQEIADQVQQYSEGEQNSSEGNE